MATILLITPGRRIHGGAHLDAILKSAVAPADLTTIAALTPRHHEVEIWDEAIRGQLTSSSDLRRHYDLIGVGGYSADCDRTIEIGRLLRDRSVPLVVGGVGVTSEPERYRGTFDVLFIGEAEYTWPKFLSDFEAGAYQSEYRQVGRVEMADSPPPRWEAIAPDINYYAWGVVQTTRGCPFDCEFCDVITLFGRKPRHKSAEQVLGEVEKLNRMGVVGIMLSDDNLYGDRSYYKPLLRELATLNRSFRRPVKFWSQISLDSSDDEEMLTLLAEANVTSLLIGIESPNMASLIEANKPQNYKRNLVQSLRQIQRHGLTIEASLIVGFDHDDGTIFEQQFKFIQEACLIPVSIWRLMAIPGTKLWTRLHGEKRVLQRRRTKKVASLGVAFVSNLIPKGMSLEELLRGYCALLKRVHDWPAFEARLEGLISRMEKIPPLMPRFKGLSLQRFVKFVFGNLVNAAGRRDMFRQLNDPHAREVKNRLMKLVPGKSPRERYLRSYIEDAVDRQWNMVNYTLPDVLRSVTDELEQLSVHGLPPLEPSTYSVPDSFREPYKVVFPSVHDRVQRTLSDKSRAEVVLVEVFHDFLTRWGPTFKGLEDYHEMQLVEICDRAVAKVNGTSHPDSVTSEHWVRVERDANSGIADLKLRRLATEVLRCVDDEFRRHKDGPALAVRGA